MDQLKESFARFQDGANLLLSERNVSQQLSRGEPFIIFSGGMPPQADQQQAAAAGANAGVTSPPPKPSLFFLTILRGSTTNVLHMDNTIIDFHVITPLPHITGELICVEKAHLRIDRLLLL